MPDRSEWAEDDARSDALADAMHDASHPGPCGGDGFTVTECSGRHPWGCGGPDCDNVEAECPGCEDCEDWAE